MKKGKKKRISYRRPKSLPPHTWNVHPLASLGEANKTLVIALISIGAVIILALLLFFGSQFVGKAYTGLSNTAGIEDITVEPSTIFSVVVKATVSEPTVAVGFTMILPAGLSCTSVESLLGWDETNGVVLNTTTCIEGQVTFEYGTINADFARSGGFDIAQINFAGAEVGTYEITFGSFDIIGLTSVTDLIIDDGLGATVTVEGGTPYGEDDYPGGEACFDAVDNDEDGLIDCDDPDCDEDTACFCDPCAMPGQLQCSGNVVEMCSEDNCWVERYSCEEDEVCSGGVCEIEEVDECILNTDCAIDQVCTDGTCVDEPIPTETDCYDWLDNDGDLLVDCADPDCERYCPEGDSDFDRVIDIYDNCPSIFNPDQADTDGDGIGDVCDDTPGGCDPVCDITEVCIAGVCGPGVCESVEHGEVSAYPECAINCESGYDLIGDVCTETIIITTVTGTGIDLTEIAPTGNLFSTKITATTDFRETELTAYTILKDGTGKVLVLKREQVEGLLTGNEYSITVNYPHPELVKTKTVIVQDRLPDQGWTVHSNLTQEYTESDS